jgi:hypothetical protein
MRDRPYGQEQGFAAKKTSDSLALMYTAMQVAQTSMMGARTSIRSIIITTFWVLVTSVVSRVIRDAVPNLSMLEKENCLHLLKQGVPEGFWQSPWPPLRQTGPPRRRTPMPQHGHDHHHSAHGQHVIAYRRFAMPTSTIFAIK